MFKSIKEKFRIRGPIGFFVFGVYRFGNLIFYRVKIPVLRQLLMFIYKILDILVVRVIGKAQIPPQTRIGRNASILHDGNGLIISPRVIIGDNVTIFHQVTIGNKDRKAPKIGNDVQIGAGAKVLGGISVGDGSTIGANAVVLKDVPPFSIAVGIPARIIPKNQDRTM